MTATAESEQWSYDHKKRLAYDELGTEENQVHTRASQRGTLGRFRPTRQ